MNLIKNYVTDDHLRKSMSKLSTKMFSLDFEMLYQKGYWAKQFNTYAISDKDNNIQLLRELQKILQKN